MDRYRKNSSLGENMVIRKAKEKDIEKILDLLIQVNMVHHNARPDLF